MEGSVEYFQDILEKMLLMDYDIFRISLIMYRNFDFADHIESYVSLTKMIYKKHNVAIDTLTNVLPKKELAEKKSYRIN